MMGGGLWSAAHFLITSNMKTWLLTIFDLIVAGTVLAACVVTPQPPTTPLPTPTIDPAQDPNFQSNGGGEPRSPGYWLVWNSCAEGNQASVALANGGKEAGWLIMDDLLADPGILVGNLSVETCDQGLNLLQVRNLQGVEMKYAAAYTLTAQLIAAQLNLAIGSEYCPVSDQAVSQAQLLLLALSFDGTKGYLGPPLAGPGVETAMMLTEQLARYNTGELCL